MKPFSIQFFSIAQAQGGTSEDYQRFGSIQVVRLLTLRHIIFDSHFAARV